ncbi:TetR/AcrR family transcriptional regulator [Subtercola sp. RTI3]|uniref:TetR/AcrR family transcriptional regulator n=1 Tax=Subtercola sp. RTI3 TaxID=3048639 RepID=UPI002B229230|nr:TetR/AcrR family transcriptional regulator [Subtercola sp. RTI3]MEA9985831.1 TetR/AcrR family transcriptional regulator [Subtercola sp. RTI3]
MTDQIDTRSSTRERIIEVAALLLRDQGQAAVTTRGVAERAGVQAPTIYRLFGDKDGLLDAVAEQVMTDFASTKTQAVASAVSENVDPVADLRSGWNMTIEFGIANPALFVLLSDPARGQQSAAAKAGTQLLADRVHRVALQGQLRVSEERAVELIHAAGTGAVLVTLAKPLTERDRSLADTMFDAVLEQIVTQQSASPEAPAGDMISHAVALRAHAGQASTLTPGEQSLLTEWLDRIVEGEYGAATAS